MWLSTTRLINALVRQLLQETLIREGCAIAIIDGRDLSRRRGGSSLNSMELCWEPRYPEAPSRGAHVLRHSATTEMLRQGATLEQVGTVLRHQYLDTTAHYAKVDVQRLRSIALPWPEVFPC